MGKGPYGDIPEENMVFNYASPRNITMRGSEDSGYTKAEWKAMTPEEQDDALMSMFWEADLIEFWVSEDEESE